MRGVFAQNAWSPRAGPASLQLGAWRSSWPAWI